MIFSNAKIKMLGVTSKCNFDHLLIRAFPIISDFIFPSMLNGTLQL